MSARRTLGTAILGASLIASSPALAGGYDTPILSTGEYIALGGAAIAGVDDPTAMFHNTAGLARTMGLTFTVSALLITGSITSSPDSDPSLASIDSEPLFAIAPLIGVAVKPVEWFAAGLAFYPVASAGAEYKYDKAGESIVNETDVKFLEITPSIAFALPGNVNIGFGWRIIMASLLRKLGGFPAFDADMSGTNFTGFRVGAQWDPIPELQLGVVFRSKTSTTLKDSSGVVLAPPEGPVETDFTLPAKLGFGTRIRLAPVNISVDLEYALQSQNERATFKFGPTGEGRLDNIFKWHDAFTLRTGVEYVVQDRYFFRGGFLLDTQVSDEKYPSAFGTPPTSTMALTAGFGMKCTDTWKFDVAVAHRFGQTDVVRDLTSEDEGCLPCSYDGHYELTMTGIYVDFTYAFSDLFN